MRAANIFNLLLAGLVLLLAVPSRAEDADEEARRVLGGTPPIYAGPPMPVEGDARYKAYRRVPPEDLPALRDRFEVGRHCATAVGLFGPGASLPVGTPCAGRGAGNEIVAGRVVSDRTGRHCLTANGLYGPGATLRVGSPCRTDDRNAGERGTIVALP